MTPRLVFDQVSKRFGARLALDRLSLQVNAGEVFGFLGPNGAGKSTAIHLAMGLLRSSAGQGQILGEPFSRGRHARSRIGYVPDAPVFFKQTALEAVLLAAQLNQQGAEKNGTSLERRARELLTRFDLPAQGQLVTRFSRGMQQRVALVQALVLQPDLLILDEPTSALDPPAVGMVRDAMRDARQRGCSVFFSSHQLQEVALLCDRAAFLQNGQVLREGALNELMREGQRVRITLRSSGDRGRFQREHAALLDATPNREQTLGPTARLQPQEATYLLPVEHQRQFIESAWLAGEELVAMQRERQTLEQLFEHHGALRSEPQPPAPEQEESR